MADNPVNAKPVELPPVLAHVQAVVDTLMAQEVVAGALDAIKRDDEKTLADQIALTEVEAPPFHEEERAKEFARRLEEFGLTATIDPEGNVLARRSGTGNGPTLVLAAHLDSVFPAGTDVKVRKEGNRYFAPGISDDTRGLAALLQVLRTLEEKQIQTVGDILFVGSVGEEGNGDLRGSKYLFNKSGIAIDGFISVDGVNVNRVLVISADIFYISFDLRTCLGLEFGKSFPAAGFIIFCIGLHCVNFEKIRIQRLCDVFSSIFSVAFGKYLNAAGHVIFALAGIINDQLLCHNHSPLLF